MRNPTRRYIMSKSNLVGFSLFLIFKYYDRH
nr:MAG TPA: hypothetical protein [Caudoviricetes sp.]